MSPRVAFMIAVATGGASAAVGVAQSPPVERSAAPLSAAIAEAERSPLRSGGYDGPSVRELVGGLLVHTPTTFPSAYPALAGDSVESAAIGFTFIASMFGHFATAYTLKDDCGKFDALDMHPLCWGAPLFPWVLVGAPAATSGVGARKAFRSSGYGALVGVTAFFVTQWRTSLNAYGSSLVSGFLHFVVSQALFR